jgi:hypothetical protein
MIETADARSGVIAGKLTCGWLDERNQLHQDYVVVEMTGVEEDLLTGKGQVLPRLNRVITNCLESLGSITEKHTIARAVDNLTATDRMILLIAIRRASLGDIYSTRIKCPSCGAESNVGLNLSTLETRDMLDPLKRDFEVTLSTGRKVRWHIMTGRDEEWLQGQRKSSRSENDVLTLAMLSRIDEVDGVRIDRVRGIHDAIDTIKRLKSRERNELRNEFTTNEGFMDSNVEYSCPSCSSDFSGELDVAQTNFFFPAGASKP